MKSITREALVAAIPKHKQLKRRHERQKQQLAALKQQQDDLHRQQDDLTRLLTVIEATGNIVQGVPLQAFDPDATWINVHSTVPGWGRSAEVYQNAHTKRDYCLKFTGTGRDPGVWAGNNFNREDAVELATLWVVSGKTLPDAELLFYRQFGSVLPKGRIPQKLRDAISAAMIAGGESAARSVLAMQAMEG